MNKTEAELACRDIIVDELIKRNNELRSTVEMLIRVYEHDEASDNPSLALCSAFGKAKRALSAQAIKLGDE